jgi:hypothetical protein
MDVESEAAGRAVPVASLLEISRVLDETARILREHVAGEPEPAGPQKLRPALTAARVRAIIAIRRRRHESLGVARGDPAWSMLLELTPPASTAAASPTPCSAPVPASPRPPPSASPAAC